MEQNEKSVKDFTLFWHHHYVNNTFQLNVIAEFERDYSPQSSIWWYTREYFVYQMLNQALRTLAANTIVQMGFVIRDLHHQIERLHQQQVGHYHDQCFIVYRGQVLSTKDFVKLLKTEGGLTSFNNFLSTSSNEQVSFDFAKSALTINTIGTLFKICIDPSISSSPFAAIQQVSFFKIEEKILFSMHTVFRIGKIKQIDNNSSLYQLDLKLTSDDDPQLRILTERIRKETPGSSGWERLGQLLLKLRQFDKAEEPHNVLLEQTSDQSEKSLYYNQLRCVKLLQSDYEKALEIDQKTLLSNHPSLATSYNNIGTLYYHMRDYSKALSYFELALDIKQHSLPPNHPSIQNVRESIEIVKEKL